MSGVLLLQWATRCSSWNYSTLDSHWTDRGRKQRPCVHSGLIQLANQILVQADTRASFVLRSDVDESDPSVCAHFIAGV